LSNNATQFLLISVTLFSTHYAAFYIWFFTVLYNKTLI
jgi:cytochrome c oxidase assembly factor CtaG